MSRSSKRGSETRWTLEEIEEALKVIKNFEKPSMMSEDTSMKDKKVSKFGRK